MTDTLVNRGTNLMGYTSINAGWFQLATTLFPIATMSTSCSYAWIAPYCDKGTGAGTNTNPIYLGSATYQAMPLQPTDISGVYIRISNAAELYVYGTVNDKISYILFN